MKIITLLLGLTLLHSILIAQTLEGLPVQSSYDNGKVHERYRTNSNGNISGTYVEYNEDGKKKEVSHYSNGILNGTQTIYDDGTQVGVYNYIKGVKEGTFWEIQTKSLENDLNDYYKRFLIVKCVGTYKSDHLFGKYTETVIAEQKGITGDRIKKNVVYITGSYNANGEQEGEWMDEIGWTGLSYYSRVLAKGKYVKGEPVGTWTIRTDYMPYKLPENTPRTMTF